MTLPEGRDPCDWYAETLPAMIEALRDVDPGALGWTLFSDRRVSTWERRMVIETGVHRWDAQMRSRSRSHCCPSWPDMDSRSSVTCGCPRLGDVPTLAVEVVDLGGTWIFGDGEPRFRVTGTASDIYLRLMARGAVRLPAPWEAAVDAMPTPQGAA